MVGAAVAALIVGSAFMVAQAAKTSTTRPAKLTKPWSEVKDLSDQQITQIKDIHEKFLEEQHALETKEKSDIMALLTDPQKKELEEAIAQDKKDAAERRVAKNEKTATTKPSSTK
jgi:hypothetical protein